MLQSKLINRGSLFFGHHIYLRNLNHWRRHGVSRALIRYPLQVAVSASNLWGRLGHSSAKNQPTMKTSDESYWNLHLLNASD